MKHLYFLKTCSILLLIMISQMGSAQVQLHELSGFGSSIYDINDSGLSIYGNGYYDFTTETSSQTETDVAQTVAINNAGQVLGALLDETGEFLIPAMRTDGVWTALPNLDEAYTYTLHAMSENGMYVVGQTDFTVENGAWGFIYNTQTETLTILSSDLYEYGAAYGVNDAGIAVGWVDDLPSGTVRQPAYFDETGNITLISEEYGEAYGINNSNMIVGNLLGQAIMYDMSSSTLTTYETPQDFESAAFSNISETGLVVGYAEVFIPGQGGLRSPIIFHPELNDQPQSLNDILAANGVEVTLDGQANSVSPDGNYLAGWTSGPAFAATGWTVYFNDLLLSVPSVATANYSIYPNPVTDVIHITSQTAIKNLAVYNVAGQKVMETSNMLNDQLNVSTLTHGMYIFSLTFENGATEHVKIVKN